MSAPHLGAFNTSGSRTHAGLIFSTHAAAGGNVAPNSAFEAADIRIYKATDGAAFSATQRSSANGITMTSPFDSLVGLHAIDIDLTDDTDSGFYADGCRYVVVLAPDETVDGQTITGVVLAYFDIDKPQVDIREFGGTAGTFSGGRPEVNTTHAAGTAWNSGAIGASTLASDTLTAAKVAADVTAELQSGLATASDLATVAGYIDTEVAAIKAKTDNLPSDPADASVVAGLIAAVEAKVDTLDTVADAIKVTTDKLDDTLEDQGGGTYGFTEEALQEAPTGGGGGGGPTVLLSGTAQAGGASSITLASDAPATNDLVIRNTIAIVGGTGAGQSNHISGYNGTTKVATVAEPWIVIPDNTSEYEVNAFGTTPATVASIVETLLAEPITAHVLEDSVGEALNDMSTIISAMPTSLSDLSNRLPDALDNGFLKASVKRIAEKTLTSGGAGGFKIGGAGA